MIQRLPRVAIVFFLGLLLICPKSHSKKIQEKINIAVAEFEGKNVSAMDASTVSDLLRTELVKTGKFSVIDRANMEQLLAEQKFQLSGCTSQECAVKIGKILNAKKVIVGSLMRLGSLYIINANVVNIETSKIEKSEKVKAESIEDLPGEVEYLAGVLAGEIKVKRKKSRAKTETEGKLGIGLNYPGVSLRYLGSKWFIEPKYQTADEINVMGLRTGLVFNRESTAMIFTGLEFDYVTFKGETTEGTGFASEIYIGMELFVADKLSIEFDIGPAYVYINDSSVLDAAISADDGGIVANIGMYYYFR